MSRFRRKEVAVAALVLALGAAGAVSAGAQNAIALNPNVGPVGPLAQGGNCAGGEIYDDGSAENGYSGNPAVVSSFEGVMQFTPTSYPASYDTVCVGLVSLAGPTLDLEIEMRDDDGAAGAPGTLLGAVPVSLTTLPGGLPCTFFEVDISSMGVSIPSGNVWIGVRWNPMLFPSRFICADESVSTPLHPGFVNFNNPSLWQTTQTVFPGYRAKLIRAVQGVDADLVTVKSGVVVGNQIIYTITVTNNGPGDATNVVVTDTLPAEVTYVSDDCGGANVPPWTWNIGALNNTASATCNITVDIAPDFEGTISNTATATADQNDPTPGDASGSVDVLVLGAVNPLEIPTVGAIGMAALALLLLVGAVFMLRRRSAV